MAKYLSLFGLMLTVVVFAEDKLPDRYQSIVDRQMFGQPPPGFDPNKLPSEVSAQSTKELTKEQEKIRSSVHFSIINITPSGDTAVGFTDNSDPKTPVHYYLKVGESSGGWTLKEADAVKEFMKIEKEGVEVELTLGQNSGKGGGTTSKVASSSTAQSTAKSASTGVALRTPRNGLLARKSAEGSSLQSFAQRKADREAKRLEEEKRREEEKAKQEEEREEMKASLAEMKEQLAEQRRLREEAAAKAKADAEAKEKTAAQGQGEGQENEEGEEE